MALTEYMRNRLAFIESGRPLPEKKKYVIPKVSEKRKAKINEQKEAGSENEMDKFFSDMRKLMVNTCQCGCGNKSQKDDDTFYRNCIAHIFPKRIFKSIATHKRNWVERSFWGGCHTNMDEKGIDNWKNFADWEDIKERFYELAPLLTDEERATKFYSQLETLVYANK
jgi:hypothetical protein